MISKLKLTRTGAQLKLKRNPSQKSLITLIFLLTYFSTFSETDDTLSLRKDSCRTHPMRIKHTLHPKSNTRIADLCASVLKGLVHLLKSSGQTNATDTPLVFQRPCTDEQNRLVQDVVRDRTLLEEFLKAMDEQTRQICKWQLQGETIREIADGLGMSVNSVSKRYIQGVNEAAAKVIRRRSSGS